MRGADTHPSGYPTVAAVEGMAAALLAASDGRLRMKVFPGGQLGEERDTLELTIFGGLDFNRVNLAPLNAIAPETIVPTLPFLFRDEAHMRAAMDSQPGARILESLAAHGLVGLCFYDSGARSFYTKGRAIHSPDDLKGLKIRVQNSDLFVSMVEALGADATPMAYGEVYQGLLQGVVDGAENNWPSYQSSRHFEAAPIYSLTRHVMAPEVLVMSARRWRKLATADQELVRDAARASVAQMRALWDSRTESARAALLAQGVTVIEPAPDAFAAKVAPVWARYLTTPALRRLAAEISAIGGGHA